MPACSNDARFDPDRKACVFCTEGTRSWGLQSEECVSCARIWLSGNDNFSWTLYTQLCKDGATKSTLLMIAIPVLSIALICCLCHNTKENGLKGVRFFPKTKEKRGAQKPTRGYNRARPRREKIPEEDPEDMMGADHDMEFDQNEPDYRLRQSAGATNNSQDWKEGDSVDGQGLEGQPSPQGAPFKGKVHLPSQRLNKIRENAYDRRA